MCFDKKNVNIKEEYFCIMDLLGRIYKSLLKIKEKPCFCKYCEN